MTETVQIYTDGACKGNPGPGGWGALLRWGSHEQELSGGELHTTNNRMELTAVIQALSTIRQTPPEIGGRAAPIEVHTDSQYVQKGITEWLPGWKRRGWKTAARKPVRNEDLWRELDALVADMDIRWYWVRGHAGHPDNERADALANRGVPTRSG